MKKNFLIFVLLLFIGTISSSAQSGTLIRYALCQKNIKKIDIVPQGNLYSLRIALTESAGGDFFRLTGNNIGNTLDIVFEDVFVTGAKIDAPVKTGYILSVPATKKEANMLRQRMLDGPDKTPCGKVL
jgi:preprotein translocase subunit SecD